MKCFGQNTTFTMPTFHLMTFIHIIRAKNLKNNRISTSLITTEYWKYLDSWATRKNTTDLCNWNGLTSNDVWLFEGCHCEKGGRAASFVLAFQTSTASNAVEVWILFYYYYNILFPCFLRVLIVKSIFYVLQIYCKTFLFVLFEFPTITVSTFPIWNGWFDHDYDWLFYSYALSSYLFKCKKQA